MDSRSKILGYSKPSLQIRAGPAPLASFEDLPTDDQFSEASLIEDLPCVSECLDDRMFHDDGLRNRRKLFQRSDTSFSADMNGSLITLTPTCSITPTELDSPTRTLTPVTPINTLANHFLVHNQFMNQPHLFRNTNQEIVSQIVRGRNETSRNIQPIEALKVPLSPSITLNDGEISDEQYQAKPVRKSSWTQLFRNRSKSTGNTSAKSPTPSTNFFSPKQSSSQLNKENQTKPKKRRMSSIFTFFTSTFRKSFRSSLQDLSKQENILNKNNFLSTNLDKVASASSPKVLNDYDHDQFGACGDNISNSDDCNQNVNIDDCMKRNQIMIENRNDESEGISLSKSFNSQKSVEQFVLSQIENVVKEKEKFDKKIKEDIYLEEKFLDIPIDKSEMKIDHSDIKLNEFDKKEVLLKRTLKDHRSDTLDEIRSLPGRLPSFRRKTNHSHPNESSQANESSNVDSETDDGTTITDQLSSKKTDYNKNDVNNTEITYLLEDDETYNEFLYRTELNHSPSRLRLQDKNERLNIKIIPIERPRSATPVNFTSFETFINSSVSREIDQQQKIRLKLPEDVFCELVNTNGRKPSPRKSPLIWQEWERGLQTPKYTTRRNSNIEDQTNEQSLGEAFTPSLGNSSTNETISEYLCDNSSQKDIGFEDDFVNACLADLANVLHCQQEQTYLHESNQSEYESKKNQLGSKPVLDECDVSQQMTAICFEANFSLLDDKEMNQTFDQNNNSIVDDNLSCENCKNCKLNKILLSNEGDEKRFTSANERDQLNCKCNCHNGKEENCGLRFLPKRRHSISSDISSASSRLICSSTSSSSSSSRRISLRDDLLNNR